MVRIAPIEGPGVCGATHPLKVAAFGVGSAFGFADEGVRPPGGIPDASQPRWPIASSRPVRKSLRSRCRPRNATAVDAAAALRAVRRAAHARAAAGRRRYASPPAQDRYAAPPSRPAGAPMSISPPGIDPYAAPPPPVSLSAASGDGCAARRLSAERAAASRADEPRANEPDDDEDDDQRVQTRPAAPAPSVNRPLPALGPSRGPRVTGSATPVEIKPAATLACPIVSALDQWIASVGAAGGAQVVRPAGGRDQADLGLLLPRHERPGRRAHLRACVRQRARHRRLRAGRRQAHHHQGRLAGLGGGAGLPARRAGRGLRPVHHRAGAGLEPLSLRSHPRRPDAARQRPAHLPAGRGRRRSDRGAGAQGPHRGGGRAVRAAADPALRSAVRFAQRSVRLARRQRARRSVTTGSIGAAASRRATSAPKTSTGSRTPARARRSTGARTGTRFTKPCRFI